MPTANITSTQALIQTVLKVAADKAEKLSKLQLLCQLPCLAHGMMIYLPWSLCPGFE